MATAITKKVNRFCELSVAYLYRNNPFVLFWNTLHVSIVNVLTSKKKRKIATYRVNHLKYRLYQMEQLIEQGNPYNIANGKRLDRLQ